MTTSKRAITRLGARRTVTRRLWWPVIIGGQLRWGGTGRIVQVYSRDYIGKYRTPLDEWKDERWEDGKIKPDYTERVRFAPGGWWKGRGLKK